METNNWEETVRKNRNALIENYVEDYGETTRNQITTSFNSIKFCFFETPKLLKECIDEKKQKLGIRYTIDFLKRIGIDITQIYLQDGILSSKDPKVAAMMSAFFPSNGYLQPEDFELGIFSFGVNNQENTDYNNLKKAIVLQKMGYLNDRSDIKLFMASPEYGQINDFMCSSEKLMSKYKEQFQKELQPLEEYYQSLTQKRKKIIAAHERDYIFSCREFMSAMDKTKLEQNPDTDLDSLQDIALICGADFQSHDEEDDLENDGPLAPGLIEYFSKKNTEILLTSTDNKLKAKIIAKRLECLTQIGVSPSEIKITNAELFTKDWYQIPSIKDKLPSSGMVERISTRRQSEKQKCLNELADAYVHGTYQITDLQVRDSILRGDNLALNDTIIFAPLSSRYVYADIDFDCLVREVIETTKEKKPNNNETMNGAEYIYLVKKGICFYVEANNQVMGLTNQNINTLMNWKLSTEATRRRQEKGVSLFVSNEEISYQDPVYSKFMPNLDLVFSREMQQLIATSQLVSTTALPLYRIISQESLTTINETILRTDEEVRETLKSIGESLVKLNNNMAGISK